MKLLKPLLATALLVGLNAQAADVSITTARGEVSLAAAPAKVATYDLSALDTLDAIGVKVGATIDKQYGIDYLENAAKGAKVVGEIKNPNLEALNNYQPDLVIVGGRTAGKYDEVKKVFANTIDMTLDNNQLFADGLQRLDDYGKLFNKTAEADAIKAKLNQLIDDTKALAQQKGTGLILLVTGNKISAYGPQSRLGWIHSVLDIKEADKNIEVARHGQPVSFEYISKLNPDWLFVLDRGAAIGREGDSAATVLDNPLVNEVTAWKKGQIVYFSAAAYLAPGGVRQIESDVSTIKAAFEK